MDFSNFWCKRVLFWIFYFLKIWKLFWNQNRHIWGVQKKEKINLPLFLPLKIHFFGFSNFWCKRGLLYLFRILSKSENCFGIRTGTFGGGVKEKEKLIWPHFLLLKRSFFWIFPIVWYKRGLFWIFSKSKNCFGIRTGRFWGSK